MKGKDTNRRNRSINSSCIIISSSSESRNNIWRNSSISGVCIMINSSSDGHDSGSGDEEVVVWQRW